ncbi:ATP-binding protein [Lentisalinibacter salinarum]|uniref:hypothetical protein n=1 Tax=Lentisalinibacter salinarum TaxID=2992239 RepID=UPI00386E8165
MSGTRAMRVANEAFLLDRLAADTSPLQQVRELTQNSIEAILRRQKAGDEGIGLIRWDVDWNGVSKGKYKLAVIDNGDGMSDEEMVEYLNSLAVQGANQSQSLDRNFGVGAKITALHHNRLGLVYQSWKGGAGHMVQLHLDDDEAVYGLKPFYWEDSVSYAPTISEKAKPPIIAGSGTKVVLLGNDDDENTCGKPKDAPGGETNWLYKYLNTRYFRVPPNIRIQVRNLRKNPDEWPLSEPDSSDKTFNFETITGEKALLDKHSSQSGAVSVDGARIYWWLFKDGKKVDRSLNPRALGPGHVGLVFQDEVYVTKTGNSGRRQMAHFGIIFGAENIVLYVEPKEGELSIYADTGRSRILIDGEDPEVAGWWEVWAEEFKAKMPTPIQKMMEDIINAADKNDDPDRRERILKRLERIRELMRPSRFRRDPSGELRADSEVTGGTPRSGTNPAARERSSRGGRGGRRGDDYLAELLDSGGEPVVAVLDKPDLPSVEWVSIRNGLRAEDELIDVAAEIQGDELTGSIIKANEDFRGFRDVVNSFANEFEASGDEKILAKIVEVMKDWSEMQLIEVVSTVRNLEDGKVWTKDLVREALQPSALTAAMMGRFFIVEKIRRELGSELSRKRSSAA